MLNRKQSINFLKYFRAVFISFAILPTCLFAQRNSDDVMIVIDDLVTANRILAALGILPGYGHVSVRHPNDPTRYYLSRSLAPELVTPEDIVKFDLDSNPISPVGYTSYLERFIHGEIYKARPDVQAIVHNHSPGIIAFGAGSFPLRAVTHRTAFMVEGVPVWDYRDFGTAGGALVSNAERGEGMAAALLERPAILMRNHGVTVVGGSLSQAVGRSVELENNAQILGQLLSRGDEIHYLELDTEEVDDDYERAWNLWKLQLSNKP